VNFRIVAGSEYCSFSMQSKQGGVYAAVFTNTVSVCKRGYYMMRTREEEELEKRDNLACLALYCAIHGDDARCERARNELRRLQGKKEEPFHPENGKCS